MNLIIDIGNTVIKMAVFDTDDRMIDILYDSEAVASKWQDFASKYALCHGIISSVVILSEEIKSFVDSLAIPILYMNAEIPIPVTNLYKTPKTLGCDRIAGVVGANEIKPNSDLLIIDAGTCITYDFIDSENCYHGGNISPGLDMRFKALHQFTGKLPLIASDEESLLLGEDTQTAIRAGIWRGIEFEIEGYVRSLKHKYPELFVFLTGGNTFSFDDSIKSIIFADRFLVLKGLNRILNFNNGRI